MRIESLELSNVKSFRAEIAIPFHRHFNVLVGPNGGGKSNLLDVVTVVLRHYFLHGYQIQEGNDHRGPFQQIQQQNPFGRIQQFLDKHLGDEDEEQLIRLTLTIEAGDLHNLSSIISNKKALSEAANEYRSVPFNFNELQNWEDWELREGHQLTYEIKDWNQLQQIPSEPAGDQYLDYLRRLELFLLLARHQPSIDLRPAHLYFSPYRGGSVQDLRANLSGENFYQLLLAYFGATSQTLTSLIKLATLYFAAKRRRYEELPGGYLERWEADEEVRLVSKYLERMGYRWDLRLVDRERNIYEIVLTREGKDFHISQASSGEKEIINFLFGIFAFNIHSGLILIDEPELHLHPRWQGLLRDLLFDVAIQTNNQFIISTHSAAFITRETIGNVRRVHRRVGRGSRVEAVSPGQLPTQKKLLHIVNTHNNEKLFFADHVVLVEGIKDRLIFEALINRYARIVEETKIVEVLEVHGKHNLRGYEEFLDLLGVSHSTIADRDYVRELGGGQMERLFSVDHSAIDSNVYRNKKSRDAETVSELIERATTGGDLEELKSLLDHMKARHTALKADLSENERDQLEDFIDEQRKDGTFILRNGEIEDYLPEGASGLDAVVDLVESETFERWLSELSADAAALELRGIALAILARV